MGRAITGPRDVKLLETIHNAYRSSKSLPPKRLSMRDITVTNADQ
jgi:hypothetical protein